MDKSLALSKQSIKTIVFEDGDVLNVGVDVHKRSYSVAIWSDARLAIVSRWTQPAEPALLAARLAACKEQIARVVYEAGPTGYSLARFLRRQDFRAEVIAPSLTPRAPARRAKSDRVDCRNLAMQSAKGSLKPVRVPTEEEEADRQVVRIRQDAVAKRRRVCQQIRSFLLQHGLGEPPELKHWSRKGVQALKAMKLAEQLRWSLDMLLADLEHCDAQVHKAQNAVIALSRTSRHAARAAALRTAPGVGPVTAMTMLTELIAPGRFRNRLEVAAMAGLAPLVEASGESPRREGPLMKSGNTRLRTVLTEAAWRWVAKDEWARECFGRLTHNTGEKKKAISAMARRLLIILWRITLSRQPYRSPAGAGRGQPGLSDAEQESQEKEGALLGRTARAPSCVSAQPPR